MTTKIESCIFSYMIEKIGNQNMQYIYIFFTKWKTCSWKWGCRIFWYHDLIFHISIYFIETQIPLSKRSNHSPSNFLVIIYNFCWKPLCNLTKCAITPCGVCLWPENMSWGCLLHLRCHQWEDCDLVFLHTLLPEAIIRRAQERTRSTPPSSPLSPGSRTSI